MQDLTAPASFGHSDCERIVGAVLAQPVLAITSLAYVAAGMAVVFWAVRVTGLLAGVAGVTLMAVGVGSFAYHGLQPSWADLAHDWPIVAAGAVYAAGLARSARRQRRSAWMTAAGIFALGLAAYVAGTSGSPLCRPTACWAVPRRLARPICHRRRMGRSSHEGLPCRRASTSARCSRRPMTAALASDTHRVPDCAEWVGLLNICLSLRLSRRPASLSATGLARTLPHRNIAGWRHSWSRKPRPRVNVNSSRAAETAAVAVARRSCTTSRIGHCDIDCRARDTKTHSGNIARLVRDERHIAQTRELFQSRSHGCYSLPSPVAQCVNVALAQRGW